MDSTTISNYVVSLLRTAVPALIGSLLSWLALRGIAIDDGIRTAAVTGLTGLAIVIWYAVWRAVEAKLPAWLTRIVLGSNTAPVYAGTTPDADVTTGIGGDDVVPDAPVADPDTVPDDNPTDAE